MGEKLIVRMHADYAISFLFNKDNKINRERI